jgi:hypothetical protein
MYTWRMIKSENSPGIFSPVRLRAPAISSRATAWLPARQIAVQDLISAAKELLLDKYWMCFSDPGKKPVDWTTGCLENMHVLETYQLELLTREFALLGRIPVCRTLDSIALAYVRLLHELLHKAEHSGSKDDSIIEGTTQYLAIHAYLGEVPEFWISHTRSDFSRETGMVANRIDSLKEFSVIELARAYFGNGGFNSLFASGESISQKK